MGPLGYVGPEVKECQPGRHSYYDIPPVSNKGHRPSDVKGEDLAHDI